MTGTIALLIEMSEAEFRRLAAEEDKPENVEEKHFRLEEKVAIRRDDCGEPALYGLGYPEGPSVGTRTPRPPFLERRFRPLAPPVRRATRRSRIHATRRKRVREGDVVTQEFSVWWW